MLLIAIVLALLAERGMSQLREWREHAWYAGYLDWLENTVRRPWLFGSPWGLALLVGGPVAAVGILQCVLQGGALSLVGLIFSAFILVLTLGPRDLGEEVHSLLDAQGQGDSTTAGEIRERLSRLPVGVEADSEDRAIILSVFIQGHERLLAVLFWFFFLGPLGAVLYRLAATLPGLLTRRDCAPALINLAQQLYAGLAWLPARLVAALYTLAGSTDDALAEWRGHIGAGEADWTRRSWQLLARVGCGALQMEDGPDRQRVTLDFEDALMESLALVRRALMLVLAMFALFTIGGWIA